MHSQSCWDCSVTVVTPPPPHGFCTTPGMAVVQFNTIWSEQCRQMASFVEQLSKLNPTVNFVKVPEKQNRPPWWFIFVSVFIVQISLDTWRHCPDCLISSWRLINLLLGIGGCWGKSIFGKGRKRQVCSNIQNLQKWIQGEGVAWAITASSGNCYQPL